jgi:16S rRNA (uracil1498-N3)-methyltransferase
MTIPRVLLSTMTSADRVVTLSADDAHHLGRVMRARLGDEVRVFDGRGREWVGRLASLIGPTATVEIAHETVPAAEPHVRLTLAIGLLKGEQMDAVVRDATMLGAFAIVPMATAHVAVPARARKSSTALERWRRVAVASAKQCGRAVVPKIEAVTAFKDVVGSAPEVPKFMCVEPKLAVHGLDQAGAATKLRPVEAVVMVGPEGGWSPREIEQASAAGVSLIHLGPRTLRAETVPTVVLTALWTAWGW